MVYPELQISKRPILIGLFFLLRICYNVCSINSVLTKEEQLWYTN